MIYVVDNIYIASLCPQYLQPIIAEIRKTIHHAFCDRESLERFISGIEKFSTSHVPRRSSPLSFFHSRFEEGGVVTVRRSDSDANDLIRMHYFRLEGHVFVSKDGFSIYKQEFLEKGGDDV